MLLCSRAGVIPQSLLCISAACGLITVIPWSETLDNLNDFIDKYLQEREEHIKSNITNLPGLLGRIRRSKKYWRKYNISEQAVIEFGVNWLAEMRKKNIATEKQVKIYKASLKNTNAKLKERSDFILIVSGIISLLGLTSLTTPYFPSVSLPMPWVISPIIIIMITASVERIAMLKNLAENEEIINVIDAAV